MKYKKYTEVGLHGLKKSRNFSMYEMDDIEFRTFNETLKGRQVC